MTMSPYRVFDRLRDRLFAVSGGAEKPDDYTAEVQEILAGNLSGAARESGLRISTNGIIDSIGL